MTLDFRLRCFFIGKLNFRNILFYDNKVCQELAGVRAVGAVGARTQVNLLDTPGKRKRMEEAQQEENMVTEQPSYLKAAIAGVKPLGQQEQAGLKMFQNLFQQQKPSPKQKKNICFGTAKTTGAEDKETLLAADVDLVASGVSKDCTNDNLKEFLENKGINVVAIETLTKDEVLPNVRTKTFKITVTAAQYELALQPEVWPYRVAVRHYST